MLWTYDLAKINQAERLKEANDHRLASQVRPQRSQTTTKSGRNHDGLKILFATLLRRTPAPDAGTSLPA